MFYFDRTTAGTTRTCGGWATEAEAQGNLDAAAADNPEDTFGDVYESATPPPVGAMIVATSEGDVEVLTDGSRRALS